MADGYWKKNVERYFYFLVEIVRFEKMRARIFIRMREVQQRIMEKESANKIFYDGTLQINVSKVNRSLTEVIFFE